MAKEAGNDLLRAATACAADAQLLCDDLSQLLFPRVAEPPTEELQASVRLLLRRLVSGVEQLLGAHPDGEPRSWELLSRSGLLRETKLIEFCLARIAETRLQLRFDIAGVDPLGQIAARLARGADRRLAAMATTLLVAEGQSRSADPVSLATQLPADLLHVLVWRVIAVFGAYAASIATGQQLLAKQSEAAILGVAATKLAFFLPEPYRQEINDPVAAGLPLFAAGLAQDFGLAFDRVVRLIDEPSPAPLLTMLRARGMDAENASAQLFALRGQRSGDFQLPLLLRAFGALDPAAARAEIARWPADPAQAWQAD